MTDQYMTVGEVADRLGITVRSIQYYDQQGILSPSAKGPQNQRLYTRQDVERLYEVICLKFAGLSLAQIKEHMDEGDAFDVMPVLTGAIRETEATFSALLRRYEKLRELSRDVRSASREGRAPDWESMAHAIAGQDDDEAHFFWRLSCIYDDGHTWLDAGTPERPDAPASPTQRELVATWHGVMAECVALMRSHEPLDSPRSRDVARRVVELREADRRLSCGRGFLLIETDSMAHRPGNAPFNDLRQEMGEYLDRLIEAYETHEACGARGVRETCGACESYETREGAKDREGSSQA